MSIKYKIQAYLQLSEHYRKVFQYHWARRNGYKEGLFNEQEAEFLPAVLALQEKPISPASRFIAYVIVALLTIAVFWSVIGKIDIIVTAPGKVILSSRTKTIASVDIASVKSLHVEEGQMVKKGDLLIELDSSSSDSDRDKAVSDETMSRLLTERSRALIAAIDHMSAPKLLRIVGVSDEQFHAAQQYVDGQYLDFITKLRRIDGNIDEYQLKLPLVAQTADDYEALAANHDVPNHAYLEKKQARIDLEGQLQDAKDQRAALIAESKRQAYDALTEGSKTAIEAKLDAIKASSHGSLLRLTAPVDGTIQQLSVHTVGGVVPAAQPLMLIVPTDSKLEVEANLKNKDVGFVHVGQDAEVKVDAFEYTKYGTMSARVVHVSQDAVQNDKKELTYIAQISLNHPDIFVDGISTPLSAGMSVNVDIKTGSRRIIEYVLSPLMQHVHESVNER